PAGIHIAWHISQTHPVIVNLGKQFHSGLKPMNIRHLPSSLLQFTDTVREHVVASYLLRRSAASSPSYKRLGNRVPMGRHLLEQEVDLIHEIVIHGLEIQILGVAAKDVLDFGVEL